MNNTRIFNKKTKIAKKQGAGYSCTVYLAKIISSAIVYILALKQIVLTRGMKYSHNRQDTPPGE